MAAGEVLAKFFPSQNEPTATVHAQRSGRNLHPILRFDAAVDWFAVFTDVLDQKYSGGGITAYIHWSADGVTTNNTIWTIDFERIGDGIQDTDTDGFTGTPGTVTDAAPGTDGDVTIASIARTDGAQIDSIAVGDLYRIKVSRDADNASDNMAADAELHCVELRETV